MTKTNKAILTILLPVALGCLLLGNFIGLTITLGIAIIPLILL